MTLLPNPTQTPIPSEPAEICSPPGRWRPVRGAGISLVDQLAEYVGLQIRNHGLRTGMRLPSVRAMADEAGLSRSTVVQAYDKLAAQGLIQSRKGSGFYVVPPPTFQSAGPESASGIEPDAAFDTTFLLRSMFRTDGRRIAAGNAGLLPAEWLDEAMVASAVRSVGVRWEAALWGMAIRKGTEACVSAWRRCCKPRTFPPIQISIS